LTGPHAAAPQRARGRLHLSSKRRAALSVIDGLHQAGSMRLMFPRGPGPELRAVMINCAGGMTGGDRFELAAEAGPGTVLSLTTQTAERVYRSPDRTVARMSSVLEVGDAATLHWLPQETILFDRSRLERRLEVNLAPDATFLMIEPLIFGRHAMGEVLQEGALKDSLRIRRDGSLIHADATRLDGAIADMLGRTAIAGGAHAVANLVLAGPGAEAHLDSARDLIGPLGGASLKAPDLLVARLIAPDAKALRAVAMPLLAALSGADIPRTWTL
jgi:urease accessory protein